MQELCKIYCMAYKQNNTGTPAFLVYPKRKSSGDATADMYLQLVYQLNKINKSLGFRIFLIIFKLQIIEKLFWKIPK